mmetsp:Transcript_2970/g.5364  ORF Transcript_2970/g.5364 Transcript_2970/m.5364 type:complete len:218 (-) Transcript_2970:898-1551(-)
MRVAPDWSPAWLPANAPSSSSISSSLPTIATGAGISSMPSFDGARAGVYTLASPSFPFMRMVPADCSTNLKLARVAGGVALRTASAQSMDSPRFAAPPASLAAVFTISPITAYSHRILGSPTRPQKQCPVVMPAVPRTPAAVMWRSTFCAATMQGTLCLWLVYPGSPNTKIMAKPLSSIVIWRVAPPISASTVLMLCPSMFCRLASQVVSMYLLSCS